MAGRITEYPNSVTTLTNGDLFDVSDYDEISAYESKSLTWANLLTNINNQATFKNIYTQDGSIDANRTVTIGSNDLDISLGVGNFSVGVGVGASTEDFQVGVQTRFDDNVGIGVSPAHKFHVVGNEYINGFSFVESGVNFGDTTAFANQMVIKSNWTHNHGGLTIKNNGSNVEFRNVNSGFDMSWRSGGFKGMAFNGAGLGISTITDAAVDADAILDLRSTTRGFLPPRMTTTQRDAISTPPAGLVIYNTTTNKLNLYTTSWEVVTSA